MKSKNKKQKGYTLLEILVIVVIIGTLSYFSVPLYNKVINRADVSDALHNIDMLSSAQAKYFIQNGRYTDNLSRLETPLKGTEAKISTTRFTYSAGNPREDDFCIYSHNNSKSYILARNYKTNSNVFCSGSDCDKIESFVKEGKFEELCGSTGPSAECNKTDEYCRRLNSNWRLREDCSCGCEKELICNKSQRWSSEKCECIQWNSCELTEDICKSLYTANHVLHVDGSGSCDCRCKYDKEICLASNADDFDEARCSCVCMNDDVKKCSEQGKVLLGDCSCVCAEVIKCEKGFIFDPESCQCKKTDCLQTADKCAKINENWILLPDCTCGCPRVEACGKYQFWNNEKCACESCTKTDETCKTENENWALLDGCKCGCPKVEVCGKSEVWNEEKCACVKPDCEKTDETCKKENENWALLDGCKCGCPKVEVCGKGAAWLEEKCACVKLDCYKTDETCKKENENYILDESSCSCICGLSETDCSNMGKNYTLNSEKCVCESSICDKTDKTCKEENINWSLLDGCKCGCLKAIACKTGSIWNEEKCACEEMLGCNKTEKECKDSYGQNFILNQSKCLCECGLSEDSCRNEGGNLNIEKCVCEQISCGKTEEECKKENENYTLDKNSCSCVCGLSEKTCALQGLNFNVAKCACEKSGCDKTEEYCKKINGNWSLLAECICGCPKVSSCRENEAWNSDECICEKNGCADVTDEYCKKMNPNYYLEGTKCRCLCGLSQESCSLEGLSFDEDKCTCKK